MESTNHDDDTPTTLALRRPDVPVTLSELASLKGEAVEIIEARAQVLQTLRVSGIRATHPEDWLKYKAPIEDGGQIVCYLQDAGCDRVRDLFGIEVYDISLPQKIAGTKPGEFLYVITGSGRSKFTRQVVEHMEGGRASTDDFCRGVEGPALELLVRKAARANLDGNITRELAGLKSVPVEEIDRAWEGTPKKTDRCRLGRGFGTRDERLGAVADNIPPPICPHHKIPGVLRPGKGNRGPFYGCPKYGEHPKDSKPWIVDAAQWKAQQPVKAEPTPTTPAAAATCDICGSSQADHANKDHDYAPKA